MHGLNVDHRDIAKRQDLGGILGGILGGGSSDTTSASSSTQSSGLLGSIVGGLIPTPSESISSTSIISVSLTSTSISSSSTTTSSSSSPTSSSSSSSVSSSTISSSSSTVSSTSVSSISSSLINYSSISPPATSTTPSSSNISPTLTAVTNSAGVVITVTATVSASATSSGAASPVGASQSFLQNKPLASGVFAVVGIVGAIILGLICVVWVRSARRRSLDREALDAAAFDPSSTTRFTDVEEKGSMEGFNLHRATSSSSNGHSHSSHHTPGGGYPVPPMPMRTTDYPFDGYGNYRQPVAYPRQQGYGQQQFNGNIGYAPPRSPNPVHDQSRAVEPQQVNPILPPTAAVVSKPLRRGSVLNSPPPSPSDQAPINFTRRLSSHSRTLDPAMSEMPVAPPLPDVFGSDDDSHRPYSGVESDFSHVSVSRALKITNE